MLESAITAGGFTALLLEALKWIIRKWVLKDMEWDFPPEFYTVAIPVLNFAVVPLLALLMVEGYEMPSDWQAWGLTLVQTGVASLISVFGYEKGIKPLKNYAEAKQLEGEG
jgi:hypothetical protein